MSASSSYSVDPYESTTLPRAAVIFPARLPVPRGFVVDELATWPKVEGRLEYVEGALWFMPPCGDDQQETTADVVTELNLWRRRHPEFVIGSNEAGMKLGGEVRAADAAVWRKEEVGANSGGLRHVPPVLTVEVAGRDDSVAMLRDKARWYLSRGVAVVWLLVPASRRVLVLSDREEHELLVGQEVPAHPALPGLTPAVADLFRQLG